MSNGKVEDADQKVSSTQAQILPYSKLYQYANGGDILLMVLGTICAMINGASLPLMTIAFGDILDSFLKYVPTEEGKQQLDNSAKQSVLFFVWIGVAAFVASYGQLCFWMMAGERQAKRIRHAYFAAILRQDIGWFDSNSTGALTSRMIADSGTIQEGISEKISLMIQFLTTFIAGFVIAFIKGWRLALVLCAAFPLLAGAAFLMSTLLSGGSSESSDAYAQAGDVAQQVISSIRTVVSFGGQEREAKRYEKHLDEAEKAGIKKSIAGGVGIGMIQFLMFSVYSLGFYYGNKLVGWGLMGAGEVLNTFFAIIIGAFSLGQAAPYFQVIGNAQGAGFRIFETLSRDSPIDSCSSDGLKPEKVHGDMTFTNVNFTYPSRPDVPILKNFNLEIKAGQTVALVGASGSGKSTIVKLLERFYNQSAGRITLDGNDLSSLNVRWLRQQIGMVSQEPKLFDTTIRQNLLYGLLEDPETLPKNEVEEKLIHSCKLANAWSFISELPNGLDTNVGESGTMLSGGQKQRIAIARALMKNPKILLLDEATSALDTESERLVQEALEKASMNRTTITIAHRLSTIKNADLILVMDRGEIIEQGTHNQLLDKKGVYFSLTEAQKLEGSNDKPVSVKNESPLDGVDMKDSPSEITAKDSETIVQISKDNKKTPSMSSLKRRKLEEEKVMAEKALLTQKIPTFRILKMNQPEWGFFFLGGLGAIGNGAVMPLFALIFSEVMVALGSDKANFWALMFLILAICSFVTNFSQTFFFQYSAQKLTRRLRAMSFRTILRQEVGFFDEESNSTGVLTTRLAEDANLVPGLTGPTFGGIIQAAGGLVAGLIIAFINCWQLSLVVLGTVPLMGLAGYMQLSSLQGYGQASKKDYEEAGQICCEAIENIRTVVTLTLEDRFISMYEKRTVLPHQTAVKGAFVSSFAYGLSMGMPFFIWAVAFFYGAYLIRVDLYTTTNILTTMFAVIFAAMTAGQVSNFMPDVAKAKISTINVLSLLDRKSKIDYSIQSGQNHEKSTGKADLVNVSFCYPIRPDIKVLKGVDLEALPGKTVALVGASGCGKSTVMGIFQRWYDISGGTASLDDLPVSDWNLENMRSHMALVGQEPVLFNFSIGENIAYGLPHEATQLQIESAAKLANIHDFIIGLPDGYDTLVGEKGGQLSGGQKQRVAIARALIRNPRLLLLDEATSALDSESEQVVQAALDEAAKGRTTLVIAHRLSTIQRADKILVFKDGVVAEYGTHSELVGKKGIYYQLSQQQSLEKKNL